MPVTAVAADDEEVGALPALERAEVLMPAEDLRRVPRGERKDVVVGEAVAVQAAHEPGELELAEEVLATARRPVRPQRNRHAGGPRLAHVGGLAVEEQIAE